MTSFEHSPAHNSMTGSVLIVDDNEPVRRLLALALETAGLTVIEADSRHAATQHLARTRPDVLVLDLQRTEQDGLKLLQQVRAHPHLGTLPVVFLAPCGDDDLRWQAIRAGADWFALRPLGMVDLAQQVKKLASTGRPRLRAIAGTTRQRRVAMRGLKRVG